MSTRGLKKMALLLTFFVALQSHSLRAQNQTVNGNLKVTGTEQIYGDALYGGTITSSTNELGWADLYTDGTNSNPSYMEFMAGRSSIIWEWQQNGYGTAQTQMTLDNSGNLVLYNPSTGGTEITLSPTGTSTFSGTVTFSGTNNTITFSGPVL